jgi:hypothetical protein
MIHLEKLAQTVRRMGGMSILAGALLGALAGAIGTARLQAPQAQPSPHSEFDNALRAELQALAGRLETIEQRMGQLEDAKGSQLQEPIAQLTEAKRTPMEAASPTAVSAGSPAYPIDRESRSIAVASDLEVLESSADPMERLEAARRLVTDTTMVAKRAGFKALIQLKPEEGIAMLEAASAKAERDPGLAATVAMGIEIMSESKGEQIDAALYRLSRSSSSLIALEASRSLETRGDNIPMRAFVSAQAPKLKSSDPQVRISLLQTLAFTRSLASVPTILQGLADPVAEVRNISVIALNFTAGPSIIPAIEPLLGDPSPSVRESAKRTIDALRLKAP